ncbi:MAG: membrane integrity-associated transporter subunit PqiC [Verrucomicrobia bacterium]|nr:membrane integrity-associated transporter subunit PqiC [Verrucomicrobiota bacterium]
MSPSPIPNSILALALTGLALAGCSVLKPSGFTPRSFVLMPSSNLGAPLESSSGSVGLGFVKLPGYLFGKNMAMRQGAHEVVYLPQAMWAERLDHALQRVIAANLTTLLPSCQVRLSAWRAEEVSAEVYLIVEQFDVDARGECTLKAAWRVVSPGGGQVHGAGQFQGRRPGPAPDTDPDGATASMSALAADLSRTLAEALAQLSLRQPQSPTLNPKS